MGISTHVYAKLKNNPEWDKMEAVLRSCILANVEAPTTVVDYFERLGIHDVEYYDEDDLNDLERETLEIDLKDHECCSKPSVEYCDVLEIDVSKLPKGTEKIKFVNSY